LFGSVSELLKWLADRATPLAALTIAISAFLWGDFRREFGVPVSFASASVLTALPAIFAVVCGAAIVMLLALVFLALVLVERVVKGGPRMIDLFEVQAQERTTTEPRRLSGRWLKVYWWATVVLSVIGWAAVVWWSTSHPEQPVGYGLVAMGVLLCFEVVVGCTLVVAVGRIAVRSLIGFVLLLSIALLLQNYVGFAVLLAVLQSTTSASDTAVAMAVVWMLLATAGTAGVQFIVSQKVAHGWYPNAPKHMVCLTFMLLAAVGIVQPLGARLAYFALGSTATPMRLCTVFVLREPDRDPSIATLLAKPGKSETVPFNFVYPTDSQFFVRQKSDPKTTWALDAKDVVATQACGPEEATAATTNATRSKAPTLPSLTAPSPTSNPH